jgi:glycine oxidase
VHDEQVSSNREKLKPYNVTVKTWDIIVVGGGIIGLSLSLGLRKRGLKVLVVEKGEPGREASYAAAGMLADCPQEIPAALQTLATASANLYPEFVHELQDESGVDVDLRDQGTVFFPSPQHNSSSFYLESESRLPAVLSELEPALAASERPAVYLKERSVDPRALVTAALKAARHREVDIVSGSPVEEILISQKRVTGVRTAKTAYMAPIVINCAGAWAGQLGPYSLPTRPVKGQIFTVVGEHILHHVIRAPEVYLVPRTDGRIVIGATVEESGFDKRVDTDAIQRLHQAAIALVPASSELKIHDAWAGLRPATPDGLPILGATETNGYFAATGHFRDGILLTPVTAHVMAQIITGEQPDYDLSAFSPLRFKSEHLAAG